MRQAWAVGYVMLYVILFIVDSVVTGGNSLGTTQMSPLNQMLHPTFINQTNVFTSLTSLISNIGTYFILFIEVIFLWYPSLWVAGLGLWTYTIAILPISIGGVISIVIMLRGVRSG